MSGRGQWTVDTPAERAIEAFAFYLRVQVEELGVAHPDAAYNEAISDVLALLSGTAAPSP